MRVLLVEDEEMISKALRRELERVGFEVNGCDSGEAAVRLAETWKPDVMLLDLMLPDLDGMEVARRVRATSDTPIIMVTARGHESDRVAGLELAADDYIVKPFSVPELIARMRAVRRRAVAAPARNSILRFRDIEMDLNRHRLTKAGVGMEMTNKEFEIMRMLLSRPDTIVRRADMIHSIWGLNPEEGANTLDVHVSVLRKKLGDDARSPRYIETVRSVGFRLAES